MATAIAAAIPADGRRRRRAVTTGPGAIAPGGNGSKAFWERITSGVSALRGITLPGSLAVETARPAGAEGPVGLLLNGCTTGVVCAYASFAATAAGTGRRGPRDPRRRDLRSRE